MSALKRWIFTSSAIVAAFAGGALSNQIGRATAAGASPYAPLSQLARVLVMVENAYVDPVERSRLYDGAVKGMVTELDPHSSYMTPEEFKRFNEDTEGRFAGIGIEVDFKDDVVMVIAPIPGSPAARAGMLSGDRIVAIDGRTIRGMRLDKIIKLMRGPVGSKLRLSVRRDGNSELVPFELIREHIHVRSVESRRMVNGVGYLRLKQFQQGCHQELLEEAGRLREVDAQPLRGLVLDLRSNPGGLIDEAEGVADEFLGSGSIYSTRHRGKIIDEVQAHRGGALSRLPLVVLVDEYSASSSELLAGALQDHKRAVVIGARTFGKGSVQTIFRLPGGAGMRLTTMRYYTPNGRAIQATGIRPDIAVAYRTKAPGGISTLRERDLDGHLAGEQAAPSLKNSARVHLGGKRPKYVPTNKLPADPRGGSDYALDIAFQELTRRMAASSAN